MAVAPDAGAGLRAVERGATLLQLRAPSATARGLEREAERLVAEASVPVLVNSRVDIALATAAVGVHLPERDVPVSAARRLLASPRLVGRSVHSAAGAREAELGGADYVVFGPVFATPSHPGSGLGLEALREASSAVDIPVLAIGGVDAERLEACIAAGAAGFAAIRYFQAG